MRWVSIGSVGLGSLVANNERAVMKIRRDSTKRGTQ